MRHPDRSRKPRLLLSTVMAWANAAVAGGIREAANAVADPTRTSLGSFMAHSSSSRDQAEPIVSEGCGKAYTTWTDLLSPQLADSVAKVGGGHDWRKDRIRIAGGTNRSCTSAL